MDIDRESKGIQALLAYVRGDSSEPVLLSAFKGFPSEERTQLMSKHRSELANIDEARTTILESMILPLDDRSS